MHPSFHVQGYAAAAPMNIPPRQPYRSPYGNETRWSTGLCHCCDDPGNCLITCICPCVTFGQIAETVNKGSICKFPKYRLSMLWCLLYGQNSKYGINIIHIGTACAASGAVYGLLLGFTGLSCLYSCLYRSRLRGQYDLEEAPCVDCLVHFCCETCALCQEYRELKSRCFDMGIGWQANVDRQSRGITVAPVVGGMTR